MQSQGFKSQHEQEQGGLFTTLCISSQQCTVSTVCGVGTRLR